MYKMRLSYVIADMSPDRPSVLTLILCGGRGRRLDPLTRYQAKPALPFAGRFRLIDVPIANSLHAGFGKIYLLTQYQSSSIHHYIHRTYNCDSFGEHFIRVLTAVAGPISR
jgi:glucose-1-phosphate adenylyltransferase